MEISGRIKAIDETKSFGANDFRKREIVVTTNEEYPQHILIEFTQDKCDLLDKFNIGDAVTVGTNIRGREWINPQGETRYFNSIQGWKINKQEDHGNYAQADAQDAYEPTADSPAPDDDLPF